MLCCAQLCLILCDPIDCSLPASSVHGDSPGKNTGVGCHVLLQGNLSNPGIESRSPILQVDSLPTEPPGKPKNTGMGSLSLLQWIFATQEWRWCLLHCRRIFFQASYRGSPPNSISGTKPRLLAASWQQNGFSTLCITTPHSNTQQRKGCFSLIFLC